MIGSKSIDIESINKESKHVIDMMVAILIKLGLVEGEIQRVYRGPIDCRKGKDALGLQKIDEIIVTNFDEEKMATSVASFGSGQLPNSAVVEYDIRKRARFKLYQRARVLAYKRAKNSEE